MSTPNPTTTTEPPPTDSRPIRAIPGSYGWPIIGPIWDRLNYSWLEGQETFFRKRMEKHKSSVYRTNVPPCFPFFFGVNPNVIVVLDVPSFKHLFDMDVIEKKNVLVGDFMPSTKFTGDMRVSVYRDTTEEQHTKVKNFVMDILSKSSKTWQTSLLSNLDTMWNSIELSLYKHGKAKILLPLQKSLFNFLSQSILGANPQNFTQEIHEKAHIMLDKWLAIQLLPIVPIPFFQPFLDLLLHSFPLPFLFVKSDYKKLTNFVAKEGKEVIERGKTEFGLNEHETIHNLLFILGFNAFGGFSLFLPNLLTNLGSNPQIQDRLRKEVRDICNSIESLNFTTIRAMSNLESFVYETLRLKPPVPFQYGRARKDFVIESHESKFEVKKGELICGFQPIVMRDPKVFKNAENFVADRFVGEQGRELLKYLYWSNGSQVEGKPSASNKQCAARDYVPLTACLFLAHMLLRYDNVMLDENGTIMGVEKPQ